MLKELQVHQTIQVLVQHASAPPGFYCQKRRARGVGKKMEALIRLKFIVLKSYSPENKEIGLPNSPSLILDHIFGKINISGNSYSS